MNDNTTKLYLECSACGYVTDDIELARVHATASPSDIAQGLTPEDATLCEYDFGEPFYIKTEEEAF